MWDGNQEMDAEQHKQVFDQWMARHKGLVLKIVRAYAYTAHDQDDLLQEVTFQLWRSIPNYRGDVAVTTWTYRVAMYTAIGWARKENNRKRHNHLIDGQEHLLPETTKPPDKRLEWLYEQIAKLDEVDRSLTIMMLDGRSYREMSDVLGLTESHVGVKINRLKKHLHDRLKESASHGF